LDTRRIERMNKTSCILDNIHNRIWNKIKILSLEQHALNNVNNCLNTNNYSYLETSGGQSYTQYLHAVHFFKPSVNMTSVAA
jgi:hypothetical protein